MRLVDLQELPTASRLTAPGLILLTRLFLPKVNKLAHFFQRHSSHSPLLGFHYGAALPTPSPELDHTQPYTHRMSHHDMLAMQHDLPTWEVMPPVSAGTKRSHSDYNVDDFFGDMKKRRMNPSYDARKQIFFQMLANIHVHFRYGGKAQQPRLCSAPAQLQPQIRILRYSIARRARCSERVLGDSRT